MDFVSGLERLRVFTTIEEHKKVKGRLLQVHETWGLRGR